ncbi:MAG TPA: sugar kinase [Anaerolineales bacterium]|nr:sugar kinase [Anaerolineales bacterium]
MTDIVTFGETMIRLSPPDHLRLEQTTLLNLSAGGAELNVAAGMARLGLTSVYISRLPSNPLGRLILNKARELGVDVSHMLWADGERAGLYFVEFGAEPRPTRVYYDRKDSAFAHIQPGMVDWNEVLRGVRLFHVGGITPALSTSAFETQKEAMIAARKSGCLVSYDVNYRAALWTVEEARKTQLPLMEYVDILITSLPDQPNVTELMSGLQGSDPAEVAQQAAEKFSFKAVLVTMRKSLSAQRALLTSLAFAENQIYKDRSYEVETIDPLGGGDACVAGFLTGYLEGDIQIGVRLGNAFSALQQTAPTDLPWPTRAEVEALVLEGGTSLRR